MMMQSIAPTLWSPFEVWGFRGRQVSTTRLQAQNVTVMAMVMETHTLSGPHGTTEVLESQVERKQREIRWERLMF